MKTKIQLTDDGQAILIKMSEGNPGALTVCMAILTKADAIDPDSALGGLGVLLSLDTLNLYGSKIWLLYKDVCGQDLAKMLAVLRAHQLGFLNEQEIHHAVDNRGQGINLATVCDFVTNRLPRFRLNKEATVTE